ncbi:MAG: hypothetical protein HeimC3_36160 [Candidatus Heimdallarchaeota archaeon LC_3]|nr:MAG: hypothetical protein HeimC3_36160 [Candidatus Heimdallarchaeota archaeon LC_3]
MKTIPQVLKNWDLRAILSIKIIPQGKVNTIFLIDTKNDSFVLKKSNLDDENNNLLEFEYLNYLSEKKIPYCIPRPIQTNTNR